ncbi:MAG TPA: SIMPL domain-containing protein [Kiloniellaceae bacterium]|nr:SIMPL domain-containing protein [Kiloniellaceae bacterium]HIP77277.1 SIMPL domain-containing protein [Kiloniellaceae bacterium]
MPNTVLGFAAALVLAIGVALAGWFVGDGFFQGRKADRYVTVKGVAEQDVKADLAIWALRFVATGNDLAEVQRKIAADAVLARDFLIASGFTENEVENSDLQVIDRLAQQYQQGQVDSRFIIAQTLTLRSADVDGVAATLARLSELVSAGLVLSDENQWNSGPTYIFSGLNDLKPAMIAEATENARAGAEQFAADSGSGVGTIRRASQGVFQILPRDRFPNAREAKQIHKTVRVVSTIEFMLQE